MRYQIKKILVALALLTVASYGFSHARFISVSNDGKYAISSNANNNIYLYNLDKKSITKVNDKPANGISANFIGKTNNFIYQDKEDNLVKVVNGNNLKVIKTFDPMFQTIGANILNEKMNIYVGSDNKGNLVIEDISKDKPLSYMYGNQYQSMYRAYVPKFSSDETKIIETTSGGELWIFDIEQVFKMDKDNPKNQIEIVKNVGQTMNAIDPNGQFVYTMDQHTGSTYNLETGKTPKKTAFFGVQSIPDVTYQKSDSRKKYFMSDITNFKFIDKDKIIVTFQGKNQPYLWAFFYTPSKLDWDNYDVRPIFKSDEYAPLTKDPLKFVTGNYRDNTDPFPIVGGYNTTFDTSVEAHKLVMAQANGDGIMVYNYNPKDESLKIDWVGVPAKAEGKKEVSKGWFW